MCVLDAYRNFMLAYVRITTMQEFHKTGRPSDRLIIRLNSEL